MNNRKSRALRKVLGLSRIPKEMNPQERLHYRQIKARYTKLPWPAKATFLDDVTALRQIWTKDMGQKAGDTNTVNVLDP